MHSDGSPITTEIDFDKDGKQVSYLRVPHSRNTSAWGKVLVPIIVFKNGTGPTGLLIGGNHGGEYEGPVSLLKLARELEWRDLQGRLIIFPALNFPAVAAGERVSPVDGRDLNRSFPGRPDGSVTEVIAHYVHSAILPLCDFVLDLHSGGYSLEMVPFISMHYLPDEKQRQDTEAAMVSFQAPYAMIMQEFTGEGLLDYAVESMGKVFLFTELGGAGRLSPQALSIAEVGVRNLLKHYDMLEGDIVRCEERGLAEMKRMEVPSAENYIISEVSGVYETFHSLEGRLEAGQAVGQVHFIQHPDRAPEVLIAHTGGTLMGTRGPGYVETGDCVALIGRPV